MYHFRSIEDDIDGMYLHIKYCHTLSLPIFKAYHYQAISLNKAKDEDFLKGITSGHLALNCYKVFG